MSVAGAEIPKKKDKEKYRTKVDLCKVLCVLPGYKNRGSQVENLATRSPTFETIQDLLCLVSFTNELSFQAAAPLSPTQLLSEFWPFFSSIREFYDSTGSYAPYHFCDYSMRPRGHTVPQNPIPRQEAHIPDLVKTIFSSEGSRRQVAGIVWTECH